MTMLFFGDFSPEGNLSIARRYAGDDRVWDYCFRCDWNPDAVSGERLPGDFEVINARWLGPEALRLVFYYLGLMPVPNQTFVRTSERPDGSIWSEAIPVPFLSDLDENGVCRCGCGYTAGTP